jgi:hypothetical protein
MYIYIYIYIIYTCIKKLYRYIYNIYIYIYIYRRIYLPVVPHKAMAEVSKIGHYRRGELL